MLALVGGSWGQANNTDYKRVLSAVLAHLEGGLELHLRNASDGESGIVQFLLEQKTSSLTITLNQNQTMADSVRHHFYLFEEVEHVRRILYGLHNTGGFYIIALEGHSPEDDAVLLDLMAQIWLEHGHSRIYYVLLNVGNVVLYNPFRKTAQEVNGTRTYNRIYQNLQGYPLRIYIFDSVYSSVVGDGATQKVLSVAGADAKLAKTVAKHLNFTPDFVWPDDEFFG